ncbi:MAG: efflux RND transporter periplasmic adaptor subunit [Solirubrobacteraceae bacterium]
MTGTTTPPPTDQAPATLAPTPSRRRVRRLTGAAGVVLVLVVVVVAWIAGVFDTGDARPAGVSDNEYPTSIATVTQGTLSSQISGDGTLEYTTPGGSDYSVVNQASGTFSKLAAAGEVFSRGQVLYRVSNNPVILLYGDTPVYRSLYEGDSGPDVQELNANLVALGYATSSELDPNSDYFSAETADALEQLQHKLREDETGSLAEGQAGFLPGQVRITTVNATLGTGAGPGAAIMQATSTNREVLVSLDASEQSEVKVGNEVEITLPDGNATPGVVSGIGTVASGGSNPTLPVYITLKDPQAAGTLEPAPVTVEITSASVKNALIVPVDALLALSGGGYAVETVGAAGVHKLVAVSLGTFDDAAGTVQVTGDLETGERIVVPNV